MTKTHHLAVLTGHRIMMDFRISHRHRFHIAFVIFLVYITNLLDTCTCRSSDGLMRPRNQPFADEDSVAKTGAPTGQPDTEYELYRGKDQKNGKLDRIENDVIHKVEPGSSAEENVTNEIETKPDVLKPTTPLPGFFTPKSYGHTKKDIYIRGHLLKHPSTEARTFHPPEAAKLGYFYVPNSGHMHRVYNFREDEDEENTSNRKKRKQSATKEQFHNYKLLYDVTKKDTAYPGRTRYLSWIFGGTVFTIIALATVTSCFVVWFRGRRSRRSPVGVTGQLHDEAGDYLNVESVSSATDHVIDQADSSCEDDPDNPHATDSLHGEFSGGLFEDHPVRLYEDNLDSLSMLSEGEEEIDHVTII